MNDAVKIMELALGSNHPYVAISRNNLACMYEDNASYANAYKLLDEAVQVFRANVTSCAEQLMTALVNIANTKFVAGMFI